MWSLLRCEVHAVRSARRKKNTLLFLAGYTKTLLNVLVREYEEDQTSLKNSIQDLRENMPPPLTASFEKPCKETAVEQLVTRFAQ